MTTSLEEGGSGGIYSCIRKELAEEAIFILDRCGLLYLPAAIKNGVPAKTLFGQQAEKTQISSIHRAFRKSNIKEQYREGGAMKRAQMSGRQFRNMYYIIDRAKEAGFSRDDAAIAAWIAHAESSLGERTKGSGTITGIYQYSTDAWENRAGVYRYDKDKPERNEQFRGFPWETGRDHTGPQVSVFLADLGRYKKEFEDILGNEAPDRIYGNDPQGIKARERFLDPENNIPLTFEDYAYLRHNTSVRETMIVNRRRMSDPDGVYEAIGNFAGLLYSPGYEPGPYGSPLSDVPDGGGCFTESMVLRQDLPDTEEEEGFYHSTGPSP